MKKKCFFAIILLTLMLLPLDSYAVTLRDYQNKLDAYKKEAADTQNAINKTQNEITQTNNEISRLKQEVLDLTAEIRDLNNEIDEYNEKIKDKINQSKQIIEYMQLYSNENVYYEYVFQADSITDLIYRDMVVKELVDYNNSAVDEMKVLIDENEKRKVQINDREKEIGVKEADLEKKLVSLGNTKAILADGGVDTAKQIKIYEDLISAYKSKGCKLDDVIGVDCDVSSIAGAFRRPTKTGYITQECYYGADYTHRGLDIGSRNGSGEKIYPVANGTVVAKYIDYYGALCLCIEHYDSTTGQWYTSTYAHMSSYAPNMYVGRKVTSDDYIGYMGNTGYSFGTHLHMELIPCRLFSDNNCGNFTKYFDYAVKVLKNGFKGPRAKINFPSGTYNSWNTR